MKSNYFLKSVYLMSFMFVSLLVKAQMFPRIEGAGVWGPEEAEAGKSYTYRIVWDGDADKVTQNDRSMIQWDVVNGEIVSENGFDASAVIKWDVGTTQGKVIASMVKDMSTSGGYQRIERTVTMYEPLSHFDLEPGYSGEPLIMTVSKSSVKQFEQINIILEEHYVAVPIKVEWNINGVIEENGLMSNRIYFPTTGTKTVSAKIYFNGTSETKTISKTVTVSTGAPDLAGTHISGKPNLGIGSQMNFFISNKYSADDVEYSWSIWPNRNIDILSSSGSSITIVFLKAGSYVLKCVAKDKRTGVVGTPASLSITVSDDSGIMRVDDELFKVNLENSILRVTPADKEMTKAVNQVQYTLCDLTTGTMVGSGYVNKDFDTAIDVSALREGIYVLYIQADAKNMKPYKFILRK